MRKLLTILVLVPFLSCGGDADPACGTYNGNTLYKGPQGGCYYKTSGGSKEYVDRNLCKC